MHLDADFALQLAEQHHRELRQLATESRMDRQGRNPRPRVLDQLRSLRRPAA
jgi:hypothetical protein